MVKKIVAIGCSAALVIGALFIARDGERVGIGSAGGTDKEIATTEELSSFLVSVAGSNGSNSGIRAMGLSDVLPAVESMEVESATVYIEDTMSTYQSSSGTYPYVEGYGGGGSYSYSSRNTRERTMTYAFTEDAVYIDVEAKMESKSEQIVSGSSATSNSYVDVAAEIYSNEDSVWLRIRKLEVIRRATTSESAKTQKSVMSLDRSVLNKWVCIDGEEEETEQILELFFDVFEANTALMDDYGRFISMAEEKEEVYSSGRGVYELEGDSLTAICEATIQTGANLDYDKKSCEIDLSREKNPKIMLVADCGYEGENSDFDCAVDYYFSFENIDNTAIKFDVKKVDALTLSEFNSGVIQIQSKGDE